MRYSTIFFICFIPVALFAQLQDIRWKMGWEDFNIYNGGVLVDFSDLNPNVSNEFCDIPMIYGYNFSDSSGKDLFYSNGIELRNAEDIPVEGGLDFNEFKLCKYCASSISIVFQKPAHPSQYYLFYYGFKFDSSIPNSLQFSLLDMSANNGKGKVIQKDSTIYFYSGSPPIFGVNTAMTAVKHANGRDWWLTLGVRDLVPQFETFLIDPDGIHTPNEQIIGSTPVYSPNFGFSTLKFSQDGSVLVNNEGGAADLFHFDRCDGTISTWKTIPLYGTYLANGGALISQDNRYFYQGLDSSVYQFDMQAPDVLDSKVELFKDHLSNGMGSMQYAPDGRVYGASINAQPLDTTYTKWENWMQGINFPSKKGLACGAKMRFLKTPTTAGYPPNYPNYRLGPLDGSPCDTLGLDNHPLAWFRWDFVDTLEPRKVEFTDNSAYEPTSWQWDFAGLGTSNDTNPIFTFPANGVYKVCLTVCNQNSCDSICHLVTIGTTPTTESTTIGANDDWFFLPNPVTSAIQIFLSNQEKSGQIRLTNLDGRVVKSAKYDAKTMETRLLVDGLPSGVYILTVTLEGQIPSSKKVIVSN